jgi:hypothetical protein
MMAPRGFSHRRRWLRTVRIPLVLVVGGLLAGLEGCSGGDNTIHPYPVDPSAGRAGAGAGSVAGAGGSAGGSAGTATTGGTAGAVGGGASAGAGAAGVSGAAGSDPAGGGGAGTAGSGGDASGAAGAGGETSGAGGDAGAAGGAAAGASGAGMAGTAGTAGSPPVLDCPAGLGPGLVASTTIFVAAKAAPGGDGSMDKPLVKIQDAIDKVLAKGGGAIAVAEGEYQESVTFVGKGALATAPTLVYGGFLYTPDAPDGAFRLDCATDTAQERATKTRLAPPSAIAATFDNILDGSGFERFHLTTQPPTVPSKGQAGGSSTPVVVHGANSNVRLRDCLVEAQDAASAVAAAVPKVAPTVACGGTACADAVPGQPGGDATAAGVKGGGTFTIDGAFLVGDGLPGKPGTAGGNGTPGAAPAAVDVPAGCTSPSSCPLFRPCKTATKKVLPKPGLCGCGGEGGAAGPAGKGGGASVALVVAGALATVDLGGTTVRAGNGGDGAPGVAGGQGGLPTGGQAGPLQSLDGESCACGGSACSSVNVSCAGACPTVIATTLVKGGAAGGLGAPGGSGGKGGDGRGGPSCAVALVGGALVQQNGGTVLAPGIPGKGAGTTADGKGGDTCTF